MISIDEYMSFMGIKSFPYFEIEYFEPDLDQEYVSIAQAEYSFETEKHVLKLPSVYDTPRFLLYHELTHIYDMEEFKTGEKIHDFCLSGYMEYHASQIELMILMGAQRVEDKLSFSMNDSARYLDWTVYTYLRNKLETASRLIGDKDKQVRIAGLGAYYNFLGLKSICEMYATDYEEMFSYRTMADQLSTLLHFEIRKNMSGWIVKPENAIILYSHALKRIEQS